MLCSPQAHEIKRYRDSSLRLGLAILQAPCPQDHLIIRTEERSSVILGSQPFAVEDVSCHGVGLGIKLTSADPQIG